MGMFLTDENIGDGIVFELIGTNGLFNLGAGSITGNTYSYNSTSYLGWPISTVGYTLYSGGVTSIDDGYINTPIPLPVPFKTDGQSSANLYVSTNGYFTIGSGRSDIVNNPTFTNPAIMAANPGDNWLESGLTNTDGDVQNVYYKTGTDGSGLYYVKLLVYAGTYGDATSPTSWIANFYKDNIYHWLETRVKSNVQGNAGPYNTVNVAQTASTTSKVWRGDTNGQNWVYMGTGVVVI